MITDSDQYQGQEEKSSGSSIKLTNSYSMFDDEEESDQGQEKESSVSSTELPKRVKLNVGRKHFEVSRDLLMKNGNSRLSKLVSDANPEDTVCIDRDGSIFKHLLNYLRHGEIMLPETISKSAFLREIEYFGIDVTEGSVLRETPYNGATNNEYARLENELKMKKRKLSEVEKDWRASEERLENEKKHLSLATKILCHYQENIKIGESQTKLSNNFGYYSIDSVTVEHKSIDVTMLNKYLIKLGLGVRGWGTRECTIELS